MLKYFKYNPSLIGIFALIIWSFSALFATVVKELPVFEMLTFVFFVSFITISTKIIIYREWYKLRQPAIMWIVGIAGIYGNDLFYFQAFKHAPASHVDIINYLWPIFVVMLTTIFTNEKCQEKHVIGSCISFLGVYLLIAFDGVTNFKLEYLLGYGSALLDAIIWAVYVLVCRRYKDLHSEVIGIYCGVCAIFSVIGHLSTEIFVMPNFSQIIAMIIIGIVAQGLAYVLWEKSIKNGNYILLITLSYFTPILSIAILILFHKAIYSHALLAATLFVTAGSLIANK